MAGQPDPLAAHPAFELADQWRNAGCADRQAPLCQQSIDLALDCEDRVDLAYCIEQQRRPGFLPAQKTAIGTKRCSRWDVLFYRQVAAGE
jgi:hypothetical protein